ncbi:hypothetical protein LQ567_07845 [Niabella pedocola]|uniref:Uncharacterized protein n=1 Tax=Niabella pedocola TaxID=1752077 RepID=A0ABS8PNK3_9BACT|nr:contact-dependent growth inhibition system immunity protein [Niabella pedocola]MCD2422668.1 hypothetical protein [Niabella pedocola]
MNLNLKNNWHHKTIEDLEQHNFGRPEDAPTSMIRRCIYLTKVPLDQFAIEDLRLMIGQGFSLCYLIPLATGYLKADLFAEGSCFPGDLLKNILLIDPEFWLANRPLWTAINDLIKNRRQELAVLKIPTFLFDTVFSEK